MNIQLYRKALVRTASPVSILMASLFLTGTAHADSRLNGLTAADLLKGGNSAELPVTGLSSNVRPVLEPADYSQNTAPDAAPAIAQSNTTVGDTFAPLTEEEIRQRLLIEPNPGAVTQLRPAPASSFLTPTAYGADWGDVYVGLAASIGTANRGRDSDGSASVGFGLGDATRYLGLEINSSINSLRGFADDGTVGFKLHRVFPSASNLAVAFGWENPIKWGSARIEPETFYGVVSRRFDLQPGQANPVPLTVSLGAGTGAYRSTGSIANNTNGINFFGSLGLRIQPEISLISSWTGSGLGFAASAAPFENPFVFTVGIADVTDNTPDGTRITGSVGYGYTF